MSINELKPWEKMAIINTRYRAPIGINLWFAISIIISLICSIIWGHRAENDGIWETPAFIDGIWIISMVHCIVFNVWYKDRWTNNEYEKEYGISYDNDWKKNFGDHNVKA